MTDHQILNEQEKEGKGSGLNERNESGKGLNYDNNEDDMMVVVVTVKSKNVKEMSVCLV